LLGGEFMMHLVVFYLGTNRESLLSSSSIEDRLGLPSDVLYQLFWKLFPDNINQIAI